MYGTKVVIPREIGLLSMRTTSFSSNENKLLIAEQLDLIEENREITSIQLANYQQKLSRGYNQNLKPQQFVTRDLVLQRVMGSMKKPRLGKLAPN